MWKYVLHLSGGIMSVILSLIIMYRSVRKIQRVSGYIFRGNHGGTRLFNLNSEGVQ